MLISEAMTVFWQTLRDTWEELYTLAIVNLVWLFSWSLPIGLAAATGIGPLFIVAALLSFVLFPVTTAGMYYVTNRVAHGKTFHFADFVDGVKLYWWRALLWFGGNAVIILLTIMNFQFYLNPEVKLGAWRVFVAGLWLAVLVFWMGMQMYFWPLVVAQEEPRLLRAWRNSAYLILANPFYAFFIGSFSLVLLVLSAALTLPFIFVGMAILGLLGNNAVLTLLFKFGVIEDPRPKPLH